MKAKNRATAVLIHFILAALAVIWLIPIVWLLVTSYSAYKGMNTSPFFPETWTLWN